MPSADVYGRLLSAPTLERGVETCLRYFLGPYLGEVLAQAGHGRDALPDPTDLARVSEFTAPVEGQVALVVVASPGTFGDPVREADGYLAVWDVRAAVLADLGDRLETREAAQFYAAAAGAALTHQGVALVGADLRTWERDTDGELLVLEGSSVRWAGEAYREIPQMPGVIAGEARVLVTVEEARSALGGPAVPPLDPDTQQPTRDPAVPGVSVDVVPDATIVRDPLEDS